MEEFRRIKRELVAKGAFIDYYQDTMQIPNGNIAKWANTADHAGWDTPHICASDAQGCPKIDIDDSGSRRSKTH